LEEYALSIRIWLVALLVLLFSVTGFAQQQTTAGVITNIVVTGNHYVTQEGVLSRMRTKVGQPYVQAQLDQDRDSIQALGFFKAVDVRATPLEGSNYRVDVQVEEFPIVKEIRLVGNTVVPTDKILKVVTIQVGQPFNVTAQKPSADAIAKLYNDRGYFALADELAPMEGSPSTVSIVIHEMMVHSVGVQGNTRTRTAVIKRMIRTKPGQPYNLNKWNDDLKRIYTSGWFDPHPETGDKQTEDGFGMDLLAIVKEARTGQATVGVTLDPTSSLAGSVRLSDSDFNGTGQSISIGGQQAIAGGGPSVDLDYSVPYMDSHLTSLSVSLYSRLIYRFTGNGFGTSSSPTDTLYTERRTGIALGVGRPIGEHLTGSVGMRAEEINTSNLATNTSNDFIQQDGNEVVGSFILNRNRRDVDTDPSRGDWLNLSTEPGYANITKIGGVLQDNTILGTHFFDKNTIEYRAYFTKQPPRGRDFDAPRRVLAFRARYGVISGKSPFFDQFFVGGSDTLRGYDDDRFWGNQMFISTLEYRYPIQKAFSVIPFVDYGGAWGGYASVNNFTQTNNLKLHLGYGIGVAFKTPLGPIRLDLGVNERGGTRTHFLIGTSF
jgi:outer membrane protein insertion porin family